ncbi:hypothetical protein OGH69_02955 [Flavobacterium sp. MFBS3-15]|uniref:hypothetical protein n=1 Tax=Flavobacterium sp. MFBS3-15 TaxID=2989816 RepID=UPI0022363143|nr:hypothetical protein [Flavobacterium sp. MFBS3-15]MCW4467912.1 hypothetical protein [Flavobacterium sp. MFBS3-15]
MDIKRVLDQSSHTIEELIQCFEIVKENGNVAVIKFDGERISNQYTVFISFPSEDRQIIRSDKKTLKEALENVLRAYIKD